MTKPVRDTLEALCWEVLLYAVYSLSLTLSDYYLFASMGHALGEQRFRSYEDVKKWFDKWGEGEDFTGVAFKNCPKYGENVQQAMEQTLNKALFIFLPNLTCSLKKKKSALHTCTIPRVLEFMHGRTEH